MIAIVVSRADSASEHVGEALLDLADWTDHRDERRPDGEGGGTYYRTDGFELRTVDDLHIHLDRPDAAFEDPDLLVVVSRHSGETGPLLTAHFTGNFGDAEYGGEAGQFARACPNAAAEAVAALDRHAPEGYEVGTECTHHGPTNVGVPSMFVELGSDEAQWTDPAGARAVARAVLDLRGVDADREKQIAGFGGGHYAPRFGRIVRETAWAVGHVAADWGLDAMGNPAANRDVLRRAVEASGTDTVLVEGGRSGLADVLADLGYRVVTETWLRETSAHPLPLVEAVEDRLDAVSEGLRFGAVVPPAEDDPAQAVVVVDLPTALVGAAHGVDADAARAAVADAAVAFETTEGGTRPQGRVALSAADPPGAADAMTDALSSVLEDAYDEVVRADGEVVARTAAFDPAAARDLGVPEGPAFGRLADGQAVEIDGERIDPAAVRTERVERFPVVTPTKK
ncbi:D-aminoacyl-tRNA deacylase [Haloplanus pelagicus]|uniref:D-aminoacyl-tRNA deacylase n=1 Tax=Haloplanus pelagicus TaxID=2949995 RepID=UPI002040774C|nr:D-aminoacyl-tRNA deacylase [Haloplanus sp. HW8-1]